MRSSLLHSWSAGRLTVTRGMNKGMKRLLRIEWDAVAGILAAVAALVMHFLHLIEQDVLLMIALVLLALLFLRDLRGERQIERITKSLDNASATLGHIQASLSPPDAIVIGPNRLRAASEDFARAARGDMIWFHVCLQMFRPQPLFDALLRPAIENPDVNSIQFVLDSDQTDLWDKEVLPKIRLCNGGEKVQEPCWGKIRENVLFIISDAASVNTAECLLSFWGEPFMSHDVGLDVPRYIFHLPGHSELPRRLVELERKYRLSRQ